MRLGFLCVLVLTLATLSMASKQPDIRSFFSSSQSHISDVMSGSSVDDSVPDPKCSKHRQSGFTSEWSADFPWVTNSRTDNGMLCQKHSRQPKKAEVGHATWVDIACITLSRQSLINHEATKSHKEVVRIEPQLSSPEIVQALSNIEKAGRKAMTGAFKCLYWLCKQEIATTNFSSLLQLGKSLWAVFLKDLEVGQNAH